MYPSVGTNSTTSSIERSEPVQRGPRSAESDQPDLPNEQGAIETGDGSPGSTQAVTSLHEVPGQALHASPDRPHVRLEEPESGPIPNGTQEVGPQVAFEDSSHIQTVYNTPDTILSEYLTTDLASTRWLDLLAADAAQADKAFSLPPTRYPSPALGDLSYEHNTSQPDLQSLNAAVSQAQVQTGLGGNDYSRLNQTIPDTNDVPAYERHAWQLDHNIRLQDHEVDLFRTFAERAALWLDVFDTFKHFSTHATRLAVRLQRFPPPSQTPGCLLLTVMS